MSIQHNSITAKQLEQFRSYLLQEEKSAATVEKYGRYARNFAAFLGSHPLSKEAVILYKEEISARYTAAGVNGMLAAVNSLLGFLGRADCKVRQLRIQRQPFLPASRALDRAELERLVQAAQSQGKQRLSLAMQTIFASGIRVSELRFITLEAVLAGQAEIRLKGKTRTVLLPRKLCHRLRHYARQQGIRSGPVFVTRGGRPLDRSNLWAEMKALCENANVAASKVFPHNLRHLFARTYYEKIPNLVELADLLGHSNINTTRIYTATTSREFQRRLDRLNLIL